MKNKLRTHRILFMSIGTECFLILFVSLANKFNGLTYAFFYNFMYGLVFSVLVPICCANQNNETLASFGIKKLHFRQYLVLLIFVVFSLGGQLLPLITAERKPELSLLKICFFPLIMTTFFEEFVFRGFLQTRIEKQYGRAIAVLFSGLLFSLYHIGYPGFRSFRDLLLLFAVGMGFAFAYQLSDNNFIVSYFVNLPNALLTYLLKSEQFPPFTKTTPLFAGITIAAIGIILKTTISASSRAAKAPH